MPLTDPSDNESPSERDVVRALSSDIATWVAKRFIKAGLGFGDFQEIARQAFCRAANESIEAHHERATTARIAVLTGLSRADVSRTRKTESVPHSRHHYRPRTDRVLEGWLSDPDFQDEQGRPRTLGLHGSLSFDELCRRYSGDIPPRALRLELLALGRVVLDPTGGLQPLPAPPRADTPTASSRNALIASLLRVLGPRHRR